jgi:hypothetical protein
VGVSADVGAAPPKLTIGAEVNLPLAPVKVGVSAGLAPNACTGVSVNTVVLGCGHGSAVTALAAG